MCELGHILSDYNEVILNVLSDELEGYIGNDTTKCHNTAVLVLYMLLGKSALSTTTWCDTDTVRDRVTNGSQPADNYGIAKRLVRDVLSAKDRYKRTVFYVMLTDGDLKRGKSTSFFPGHVFVLERLEDGSFNVYQSYIKAYNLRKLVARGHLHRSRKYMEGIMSGLLRMAWQKVWDKETTSFWKTLTDVDASEYEGYRHDGAILMCYKAIPADTCLSNLLKLSNETLTTIRKLPPHRWHEKYDENNNMSGSMTNADVGVQLHRLIDRITNRTDRRRPR